MPSSGKGPAIPGGANPANAARTDAPLAVTCRRGVGCARGHQALADLPSERGGGRGQRARPGQHGLVLVGERHCLKPVALPGDGLGDRRVAVAVDQRSAVVQQVFAPVRARVVFPGAGPANSQGLEVERLGPVQVAEPVSKPAQNIEIVHNLSRSYQLCRRHSPWQ